MPTFRNATLADLQRRGVDARDVTPGRAKGGDASPAWGVSVLVFVKTPNPTNVRMHHMARHRQVQQQYGAVWGALFDVPRETRERLAMGCVVTLTRVSAGKPDKDDGLRACLKSVKDCIAVWLFDGTYGQRDDDDRADWRFAWERGKRGVPAVRINIEPRGPGVPLRAGAGGVSEMRVVFTRDIEQPACGDHPILQYAQRGQQGELIDKTGEWPAYVRLDNGTVVGVDHDEYRAAGG